MEAEKLQKLLVGAAPFRNRSIESEYNILRLEHGY